MDSSKGYEYKTFHKKKWIKVFYHTIVNGVKFSSLEEVKYITNNTDKYSVLSTLNTRDRIYNNKYEFMIEFDNDRYTIWQQTNSPLDEEENETCTESCTASGFKRIRSNIDDPKFGGLLRIKRTYDGYYPCLIKGTLFNEEWYYTIGMNDFCYCGWNHTYIPAQYKYKTSTTKLWLRVPLAFTCSLNKSSKSTLISFMILICIKI